MPVIRRRTIPETVEGTEIRWALFDVNADRPYVGLPGSAAELRATCRVSIRKSRAGMPGSGVTVSRW